KAPNNITATLEQGDDDVTITEDAAVNAATSMTMAQFDGGNGITWTADNGQPTVKYYAKDQDAETYTTEKQVGQLEEATYKVVGSVEADTTYSAGSLTFFITLSKASAATTIELSNITATQATVTLTEVVAAGTLTLAGQTNGDVSLTGGASVNVGDTTATITFASGSIKVGDTYTVTLTPTNDTLYSAKASEGVASDAQAKIGGITLASEEFAVDDKVLTSSTAGTFVDQYGNTIAAENAATAFANNTDTKTDTPATDNAGGGLGTLSITDDGKLKLTVTNSAAQNDTEAAKTSTYSIVIGGSTVTFEVSVAASATVFSGTVAAGATPNPEP
ncbi:hypothetical protein SAMN02910400_02201, partial [Lachnospiraceae bacterium C10]